MTAPPFLFWRADFPLVRPLPFGAYFFEQTIGGNMTESEKSIIRSMRTDGVSYERIAETVGMTANAVKLYCRRNNLRACDLNGESPSNQYMAARNAPTKCPQCGQEITTTSLRANRRFCSDECRYKWWNTHRSERKCDNVAVGKCARCGKIFRYYGAERKYCSRSCYMDMRFGEA